MVAKMVRSCSRPPVGSDQIDWSAVRDRADLAAVATALLGPPPGRRGGGRGFWWICPFHQDINPSFSIKPGERHWRCRGCGEHGDAANLVMRLRGGSLPEAVRVVAEFADIAGSAGSHAPLNGQGPPVAAKAPSGPPGRPSALSPAEALALVTESETRLWGPEGEGSRGPMVYLTEHRGLTPETIRLHRLGCTPPVDKIPWKPPGIVIP